MTLTATVQPHISPAPSAWVQRWTHLIAPGGSVLDVACGYGRHAKWFVANKNQIVAVDRLQEAVDFITTQIPPSACEAVVANIENGPWPFVGRQFDAVVVTHYLWRPLIPTLLASLAPGGVLIYETFAQGNETVGKPSRPDFLLQTGELLGVCHDLRVVAFEDGFESDANGLNPRFVQRIAAVRPNTADSPPSSPTRYPLAL